VHTHYRLGDILANAITHGVGAVLAIAGAVYLIAASMRGSTWLVSVALYFPSRWYWSTFAPRSTTRWYVPARAMCFMCSITRQSTC